MIPQSFIQELIARVDIVEVVGRTVKLRKAGANFLGLCPFHGEKSPSFTVSPAKQFYHCFGCGAHGSAIGFLMEQAGLGYVDAIQELARSLGLTVPDERVAGEAPRRDPGLLEATEAAARFYKQRLRDSPTAIEYLKGRGVSGEIAARFGLGYAPPGWRGLQAAVADYFASNLLDAGLVIEPEDDEPQAPAVGQAPVETGGAELSGQPGGASRKRRYDRFRDRVMFPIRNPRGQVIGFGGRVLGKGEPKYLNSPETPLFSKGRELYGLYEGRDAIRKADCIIVVEGYMDVVMLAQHGVGNAVATLGTATTAQHAQKLLRLVDRVVFAFDGDAAGRRAAWRALESCLPHVADTKRIDFLFLPAEHDPDSFVREHGPQGFAEQLAGALPLSEFLIRELSSRVDLNMPEGRARFQAEARPMLLAMPPVALRLQLMQAIAAKARISTEDLAAFVGPATQSDGRGSIPTGRRAESADAGRTAQPGARRDARPSPEWAPDAQRPWQAVRRRPVSQAELPDLQRQVCFLLALQPTLSTQSISMEFLPKVVVDWMGRLAEMPAGTPFAGRLEALRQTDPELAASLQAQAARDRGLLADLDADALSIEVEGALSQLRVQGIREEVDRLAAAGLQDEASRHRYAELLALRKTFSAS